MEEHSKPEKRSPLEKAMSFGIDYGMGEAELSKLGAAMGKTPDEIRDELEKAFTFRGTRTGRFSSGAVDAMRAATIDRSVTDPETTRRFADKYRDMAEIRNEYYIQEQAEKEMFVYFLDTLKKYDLHPNGYELSINEYEEASAFIPRMINRYYIVVTKKAYGVDVSEQVTVNIPVGDKDKYKALMSGVMAACAKIRNVLDRS